MNPGRRTVIRGTAALALILLVAACSAGGGSTAAPATDANAQAAASETPAASSAAPTALPLTGPSVAPVAGASPTSTPAGAAGGGRYGGGSAPTTRPTSKPTAKPTTKPAAPAATVTIKSGPTTLGAVLVDAAGLTLYVHAGDSASHSTCTGGCASAWPPLLVKAGTKARGGPGVHGTFTTFKRSDGGTQVAYNGKPLYSWTGDYAPGDTTGQGVGGFTVATV